MHETPSLDAAGILWRLGATMFFVVLNGYFVAAEFALVKVRAGRIQDLARKGNASAKSVKHILGRLDLYLSGCQLGITLASLALGALGEPAVSRLIIAGAERAGLSTSGGWVPIVSIILAFALITIFHMTLGEQAPKMWALTRSEPTAMFVAPSLRVFTFVFRPFIDMINRISNWMLRAVGLPAGGHNTESILSVDEIRSILTLSARAGEIGDREYELTTNIFHLTKLEVRHIMVPRVDVEYLSLDRPLPEILQTLRDSSHSRFPVCERELETLIGFVHGKDVLESLIDGIEVDLQDLAREAFFVSDTMALSDLLREMQRGKHHVAAVVDEHGTVTGVVFREDALEVIVGPLGDEFDDEAPVFKALSEGVWEARGSMAFPDICERLDVGVDDEGEETIGGWMIATLGKLPKQGDTVALGRFKLVATKVEKRRITLLRVEEVPVATETAETGADLKG